MPTPFVQGFRQLLSQALRTVDPVSGKSLSSRVGVYGFYDYDGEPIYVGQTTETFGTRIGRHLTGQRTDTVAYRILDPFEVAEVVLWPLDASEYLTKAAKTSAFDQLEYSVYINAINASKYHAILNEKIPPVSPILNPVPDGHRFDLVPPDLREEREHADVRIARRAETLARVAAVAHERGEVSAGLRRVIVIQAVRLADLAAGRLAYAEGRLRPSPGAIDVHELIGNVMKEFGDDESDSVHEDLDVVEVVENQPDR